MFFQPGVLYGNPPSLPLPTGKALLTITQKALVIILNVLQTGQLFDHNRNLQVIKSLIEKSISSSSFFRHFLSFLSLCKMLKNIPCVYKINNRLCRQWKYLWDRKTRRGKYFIFLCFRFSKKTDALALFFCKIKNYQ